MHRIRRSRSIVAPWLVVTGKHVADADTNNQSASNRGEVGIDAHGQKVVMLQRVMMRPWAVGDLAGS
ncbi:MAG: hypothetical protein ACK55Z_14480 [bacterium]